MALTQFPIHYACLVSSNIPPAYSKLSKVHINSSAHWRKHSFSDHYFTSENEYDIYAMLKQLNERKSWDIPMIWACPHSQTILCAICPNSYQKKCTYYASQSLQSHTSQTQNSRSVWLGYLAKKHQVPAAKKISLCLSLHQPPLKAVELEN